MPGEYSGSGDPRRTIELLWGVRRRRRGPRPSLSGDQIVAKAIELTDRDGLSGLSMRSLPLTVATTIRSSIARQCRWITY